MLSRRRFLCALVLLFVTSCQWQEPWHDVQESRFLLGTIVSFTIYSNDETSALKAIQQAASTMQAVEQQFTTFGSVANSVQRLNHAEADEIIGLDQAVDSLLRQSISIYQQTLGAFDPALGALNQAWGFSDKKTDKQPLSPDVVQRYLDVSGMRNLQDLGAGKWSKKHRQTQLDFGAIAKGFAIDQGIKTLRRLGFKHAIINAGGDLRVIGDHGEQAWKVAIRHPRRADPLGWFEVKQDMSIVTSGDYERFFMYENKRYHHIIDPKTGLPAYHNMSVTVLAKQAAQADALSTAMFILEAEKGLGIIENMPGVEALWLDKNQRLYMSSGMKKLFHQSFLH